LHQSNTTIIILGRQALKYYYPVRVTFSFHNGPDHKHTRKQAWAELFDIIFHFQTNCAQYPIPDGFRSMAVAVWRGLTSSFFFFILTLDYLPDSVMVDGHLLFPCLGQSYACES
jgi:hypothetical protein